MEVASGSGTVVLASRTFPSSTDEESEAEKRKQRKEKKVTAILHESVPVRFWDHDLGPDRPRLFAGAAVRGPGRGPVTPASSSTDLTPDAGTALLEQQYDVSPDGSTVATTWTVPEPGGLRFALALVDVASGERRLLLDDADSEYGAPRFSPDGTRLAVVREQRSTPYDPPDQRLCVVDVASGELRDLTGDWDHWPGGLQLDAGRLGPRARRRRGRTGAGLPARRGERRPSPG